MLIFERQVQNAGIPKICAISETARGKGSNVLINVSRKFRDVYSNPKILYAGKNYDENMLNILSQSSFFKSLIKSSGIKEVFNKNEHLSIKSCSLEGNILRFETG